MSTYSTIHSINKGIVDIVFRRSPFTVGLDLGYSRIVQGRRANLLVAYEHHWKTLSLYFDTVIHGQFKSLGREIHF